MKIDRLSVEAFGHFQRFSVELLGGLNVLYGSNEAGKSTLLAFVRAVLFGFERKTSAARYEPDTGPFGGELHLSTAAGPLCVRRAKARAFAGELIVRGTDGARLPEAELVRALGGISRELFYQVFAFGLDELSSFEELSRHGAATEALFGAGVQGGQRLGFALETLRDSLDKTYTPRGSSKELPRVLRAIEEIQDRLRAAGERPAEYLSAQERLAEIEPELSALECELGALRQHSDHLLRLMSAGPDLVRARRLQAMLAEAEDFSSFPVDAKARLGDLGTSSAKLRAERAKLLSHLSAMEHELSGLDTPLEAEREAELNAALQGFRAYAQKSRDLPARHALLGERRRTLVDELGRLGLGSTTEALAAIDLGAEAKAQLVDFRNALAEANGRLDVCERRRLDAQTARSSIEAEVRWRSQELTALPPERLADLRSKEQAVEDLTRVTEAIEITAREAQDKSALLALHRQNVEAEPRPVLSTRSAILVTIAVGVALAALVAVGGPRDVAVGSALSVALLGTAWVAFAWARRAHQAAVKAYSARAQARAVEEGKLLGELQRLAEQRTFREQQRDALFERLGVVSIGELDAYRQVVALALSKAQRREQLLGELEPLGAELGRARAVEVDATADRDAAAGLLSAKRQELKLLLERLAIPSSLGADEALDLWKDAAALRRSLRALDEDEAALRVDERACAQGASPLLGACRALGIVAANETEAEARLTGWLETCRKARARRDALARMRQELVDALAGCDAALADVEQRRSELLLACGAEDEESVHRRAQLASEQRALRVELRELIGRIEGATGLGFVEACSAFDTAGGVTRLEEDERALREQVGTIEQRCRSLAEERGALREKLQRWEQDPELDHLREREESLLAAASHLAQRYLVDRVALGLLRAAQEKFEREHQPRVIQLAARNFRELTNGRYPLVYIRADEQGTLWVEDDKGERWPPEKLSRGTREQLYLSFRLAVIEDFGRSRLALPILLDDILVNFDPERQQRTIAVLSRLAEHHQTIAFTCHPHIRDMFARRGAHVVDVSPRQLRLHVTGS